MMMMMMMMTMTMMMIMTLSDVCHLLRRTYSSKSRRSVSSSVASVKLPACSGFCGPSRVEKECPINLPLRVLPGDGGQKVYTQWTGN